MLTFKVGQIIKIKSLTWFNAARDIRTGWIKRFGECFTEKMANQLCDREFVIDNIIDDKFYSVNNGQLIFEYAVDIIESALLNKIHIPVIVKGSFPGYDKLDERTITEITLLVIYKLNNGLPVDASPLDFTKVEKTSPATKRRGRPKGSISKSKSKPKVEEKLPGLKLDKGELVIYWNKPSKSDFGIGTYIGVEGKSIQVIVDEEIKTAKGVMKYSKLELDKLVENSVKRIRSLDKELKELNTHVTNTIKDIESRYGVKLSEFTELKLKIIKS